MSVTKKFWRKLVKQPLPVSFWTNSSSFEQSLFWAMGILCMTSVSFFSCLRLRASPGFAPSRLPQIYVGRRHDHRERPVFSWRKCPTNLLANHRISSRNWPADLNFFEATTTAKWIKQWLLTFSRCDFEWPGKVLRDGFGTPDSFKTHPWKTLQNGRVLTSVHSPLAVHVFIATAFTISCAVFGLLCARARLSSMFFSPQIQ